MTAGGWLGGFSATLGHLEQYAHVVKLGENLPPNWDENNKYTVLEEYIRHSPDIGFTLTLY